MRSLIFSLGLFLFFSFYTEKIAAQLTIKLVKQEKSFFVKKYQIATTIQHKKESSFNGFLTQQKNNTIPLTASKPTLMLLDSPSNLPKMNLYQVPKFNLGENALSVFGSLLLDGAASTMSNNNR